MAEKNNKLISGVLILTLSNMLVKVIGLIFKIPLTNIIGDEGMGYFNAAYSIYSWFYLLSTAGLPVAVSILVADCRAKGKAKEIKTIFRVTLLMFILIGLAGMSIMMGGSKIFARAIGAEPAYLSIMAIAPTLFFICISSAIRGYFQGCQNMIPTAFSQVIEAVGKLAVGILLALYSMSRGFDLPTTAAYTIFGLVVGTAASMLFLTVAKILHNIREPKGIPEPDYLPRTTGGICAELLKISIPIALSASVMQLTNLIDSMIVINRLKSIGYVEQVAVTLYGNYTALVVPMFNLPPALIYPISIAVVPLISTKIAKDGVGTARDVIRRTLKVTAMIIIPCALGLSAMAEPILKMFFKASSAEMAAPLLSLLAISSVFVGILSVTNAILQATGHERQPIVSMLIGALVKLTASWLLIGALDMYGTPISTFICYLTITGFNFFFVAKHTGVTPEIRYMFLKPLISGVLCAFTARGVHAILLTALGNRLSCVAGIASAAIVYLLAMLLLRGIDAEDVSMIPGGKRIAPILTKLKLLK